MNLLNLAVASLMAVFHLAAMTAAIYFFAGNLLALTASLAVLLPLIAWWAYSVKNAYRVWKSSRPK